MNFKFGNANNCKIVNQNSGKYVNKNFYLLINCIFIYTRNKCYAVCIIFYKSVFFYSFCIPTIIQKLKNQLYINIINMKNIHTLKKFFFAMFFLNFFKSL